MVDLRISRRWGKSPGWFFDQPVEIKARLMADMQVELDPAPGDKSMDDSDSKKVNNRARIKAAIRKARERKALHLE